MNKFFLLRHAYFSFSLSEILLVILILGSVFAISISAVLNYKDQQIAIVGAEKAYSVLSQVALKMQNDGIDMSNYICQPPELFKQEFLPYFDVIQDCGLSGCVAGSETSSVYKSLTGEPGRADYFSQNQFVTKDGYFIGMHTCESVGGGKYEIWVTVDINGYKIKPNVFGKDTFFFVVNQGNKIIPNGMKGTWGFNGCSKFLSVGSNGVGCTSRILLGDVGYW